MYLPVYDTISKDTTITVGEGALYSVLAIAMVFAILLIIIGVTYLVFKLTGLFDLKKELDAAKKAKESASAPAPSGEVTIKDDDMMAAVLVATIDYRLTHKSDVRVVSVKEIN
ncbi:MAG: OadG family protein [Bacilli bacterium]|nr:OadG family protein [Bacilli bacterium]MBR6866436.1 OadG family protein [Bacilli bacterium]